MLTDCNWSDFAEGAFVACRSGDPCQGLGEWSTLLGHPCISLFNDSHVVRPWNRAKPADPRVPSPPPPSALETSEVTLQGS